MAEKNVDTLRVNVLGKADQYSEAHITWTEEEEARVRHKLDWQIVPLVTLLYLLCFLDRANSTKRFLNI